VLNSDSVDFYSEPAASRAHVAVAEFGQLIMVTGLLAVKHSCSLSSGCTDTQHYSTTSLQGILGVIDGVRPLGFENDDDKKKRHEFLRMIGEQHTCMMLHS
jgi:adenosine/AMP kinase